MQHHTPEDLITQNTDSIIPGDSKTREELLTNEQYQDISAVKTGRSKSIPKAFICREKEVRKRHCQTLWEAKIIYPELFKDLDMNEETKEFHSTFYNYELIDE